MPRTTFTQADVMRVVRAAKKGGATSVEIRLDGSISIGLTDDTAAKDRGLTDLEKWRIKHGKRDAPGRAPGGEEAP